VQVLRKIARSLSLLLLLLAAWLPAAASELACPSMDVYLRDGCPHCADAKAYLQQLQQRHPDLSIRYHEVGSDPQALRELLRLSQQYGIEQAGVPSFLICEAFYAGFAMAAGSDEWIENQLLDPDANRQPYQVRTPLGEFSVDDIGLPAFTLALGLIDGFNPCAMWILLFLLSILVNIRSRRRIILIAGTFVVVSGMVYFAFMAAWLNLFLLIGFTRWLQIVIGVLALLIGAVHIKDFVAFGQGVSLSISDSVKPTLYARVRNIMHARSIWAALIAVTIVAIMVNMIELLCTAGLPAIYTQLLSLRPMTTAQYYGYLVLYNLAYIFDDALMVTITVFTMNRLKLQEKQGRWLKLISGLVIFTLGLILLTAPGMLI
jgi:glutaredoxin